MARKSKTGKPQAHSKPSTTNVPTKRKHSDSVNDKPTTSKRVALHSRPSATTTIRTKPLPRAPKPQNHASLPTEPLTAVSTLLPPRLASLQNKYTIEPIPVASSSRIASKTSSVLSFFTDAAANKKNIIVALTAKAATGNKLISIAEIAKRELAKKDVKIWQYTRVYARLEELDHDRGKTDRANKAQRGEDKGEGVGTEDQTSKDQSDKEEEGDVEMEGGEGKSEIPQNAGLLDPSSGDFFETMETSGSKKVRNTPVLVVFLTNTSVAELKIEFGEQMS